MKVSTTKGRAGQMVRVAIGEAYSRRVGLGQKKCIGVNPRRKEIRREKKILKKRKSLKKEK